MIKKKVLLGIVSVVLVFIIATVSTLASEAVNKRKAIVDLNNVIAEDFKGVGSNLWQGTFTKSEMDSMGSNEANFALSERRTELLQPATMRFLVLPSWIVNYNDGADGANNWKNGVYNWESEEMLSCYKWLDSFKKTGTEVQINFGGAVDNTISNWYAIKDTSDVLKSAPADLESFGKAASALLCHLWDMGYDNVKYLSFYNEVNGNNYQSFGDEREYWTSMLKYVDAALRKDDVRNKVKIVGTELTADGDLLAKAKDWLQYVHENGRDSVKGIQYYDVLSMHVYLSNIPVDGESEKYIYNYASIDKYIDSVRKVIGDDELWVTEYTWNGRTNKTDFEVSMASHLINFANNGITNACNWFYCGTIVPTIDAVLSGMWDFTSRPQKTAWYYNEVGLMMRYVPKHSNIVKVETENDDILATAFVAKDGNITVLVEADKTDVNRDLTIDFGRALGNKTFKKFVATYPEDDDVEGLSTLDIDKGNAMLSECKGTFTVDTKLEDTLVKEHHMIIYTTMDEAIQVVIKDGVSKNIAPNSELLLEVEKVIGFSNQNVTWEIYKTVLPDGTVVNGNEGEASISSIGLFDSTGLEAGTQVAVKAIASDGVSYGIVLVTVK